MSIFNDHSVGSVPQPIPTSKQEDPVYQFLSLFFNKKSFTLKFIYLFYAGEKKNIKEMIALRDVRTIPLLSSFLLAASVTAVTQPYFYPNFSLLCLTSSIVLSCVYHHQWRKLKEQLDSFSGPEKLNCLVSAVIKTFTIPAVYAIVHGEWPAWATPIIPFLIFARYVLVLTSHHYNKKPYEDLA